MENQFKALNDSTRRQILELLIEKSHTAGEIANRFTISKPSISHHLDLLKQADLIIALKKGQFIHYSINRKGFDEVTHWFEKFNLMDQIPAEKPRYRISLDDLNK
jgi:ArsR family transcriptional regulator, arsenate/arsenite/antimonite-responsive transcriptional repressor